MRHRKPSGTAITYPKISSLETAQSRIARNPRRPPRDLALALWRLRAHLHGSMPFSNLPALLAEALAARGYAAPTPVQAQVIEPQAEGRDLIVSAQTGSGKTVAFGLAMAGELLGEDGRILPSREPLALIIAPTRELALQVSRELMWLYGQSGARIATCVGGMDAGKERRQLGHGAHIVVGTPGRLRDHLDAWPEEDVRTLAALLGRFNAIAPE